MNQTMDMKIGQVVRSKAGRDKGAFLAVYQIVDEQYVLLVDGDRRTLSRPKKKKVKHLARTNTVIPEMEEILEDPDERYNAFIKRTLKSFQEKVQ